MLDTSARLLRILSLLQARPQWTGPELAERLGVTTRTVRRDVDRLRQLGYPVDAAPGAEGGYRLGVGGTLPPLLLDDDEAIAVAIALGASTGGAVRGIEEAALAALAKLDRLLPPRLRHRVEALQSATVRLGAGAGDDGADAELLTVLAQASAAQERVLLTYRDREGRGSERRVEPYRLVCTGRRWYLVAHDVDRRDWRTFRVDRVEAAAATGHRFRLDDPPDAAALVNAAVSVAPYRHTARVAFAVPVEELAARIPPTIGVTEADGPDASVLVIGVDRLDTLVGHLVAMDLPFEAREPPELRALLHRTGARLVAAHGDATGSMGTAVAGAASHREPRR